MHKDKEILQMAFDFDLTKTPSTMYSMKQFTTGLPLQSSAVVISLQDMVSRRENERQAILYGQIASSIAHLR